MEQASEGRVEAKRGGEWRTGKGKGATEGEGEERGRRGEEKEGMGGEGQTGEGSRRRVAAGKLRRDPAWGPFSCVFGSRNQSVEVGIEHATCAKATSRATTCVSGCSHHRSESCADSNLGVDHIGIPRCSFE